MQIMLVNSIIQIVLFLPYDLLFHFFTFLIMQI